MLARVVLVREVQGTAALTICGPGIWSRIDAMPFVVIVLLIVV